MSSSTCHPPGRHILALEWQAGFTGGQRYGALIKAVPVESVVLVRAMEVSASGPGKAKYTFGVTELREAADR